jgi:hypothetical protein
MSQGAAQDSPKYVMYVGVLVLLILQACYAKYDILCHYGNFSDGTSYE